jgi:protein-disulfide isomerase
MRHLRSATTFVTLALVVTALAACNKADASNGKSSSAVPAVPATLSVAAPTPPTALSAPTGDTLTDSVLIARADQGRLMGRDSGAIWVVMMSDFQCPYCKTWHDASMANLTRDYVKTGRVRMAYLNLPLPMHPHARAEAEAALCAGVQKKFWEYSEALFAKQPVIAKLATVQPTLDSIAKTLSLDMPSFGSCQKREAIRALVESDIQQATKAGVNSTPSFLIGDFLVQGALEYPDFRRAIDTALFTAKQAKRAR